MLPAQFISHREGLVVEYRALKNGPYFLYSLLSSNVGMLLGVSYKFFEFEIFFLFIL
jgi:hypothetical protein